MIKLYRVLASASMMALLVAGCTLVPLETEDEAAQPEPPEPAEEQAPTAEQPPADKVQHELSNPAVVALWQEAEQARSEQRLDAAVVALERALRIDPADPVLWSRLSELQLRQGEPAQAENFAAKSNALAGNQLTLRYRNWLIIESSRRTRGDVEGTRDAQLEVRKLKDQLPTN